MSRTVIVTGGFGSLGVAVGRAFAQAGWQVALVDRAPQPQPAVCDEFSGHLLLGNVNLADLTETSNAFSQVDHRFGGVDALINVAGGFRWETLDDGDLATWDLLYQMNLRTAATCCKVALAHLKSRGAGRIVNIAAGAAIKAPLGMGAYAASKAGVMRLTEALAEELKDHLITVNAILPSIIDTPQNRAEMVDADFTRWVQPSQIAEVILFLASNAASSITGASIPVNGRI
ncbi:SDR family NAD(P)-dependent oxidoreductase [Pseudomonas sp. CG7]|uniref:SDR family NAD(P)-dependent oxidoreductase n=1 Tax=Pseudomonas sp. CG7 TaxID=191007 RepID=UPI002033A690|nr:SDR family NAD(P)-dependent oxidoreductase [Pseudomonas sp. CG7]MCM2459315.1 SDR family NAD(P)-dependent oxidoreductase [Pseudomonas sp. CG7]